MWEGVSLRLSTLPAGYSRWVIRTCTYCGMYATRAVAHLGLVGIVAAIQVDSRLRKVAWNLQDERMRVNPHLSPRSLLQEGARQADCSVLRVPMGSRNSVSLSDVMRHAGLLRARHPLYAGRDQGGGQEPLGTGRLSITDDPPGRPCRPKLLSSPARLH